MKKLYVFIIVLFLISGCTQIPKERPLSSSQYTYLVILKGLTAHASQELIMGLKNADNVQSIETVELSSNFAEYRVWSQYDSGSMYNKIISIIDSQKKRLKVSYVSDKFVIRKK